MGCANAKPEVHTKKPQLNPNSNVNPSQTSQQVQNPVIKPQIVPSGKQNIVPVQQPNLNSQQNLKSNLSDIQKNPYLTRQQVKEQLKNKQQQFKNPNQPIPVRQVINQPLKTNNFQSEKSPKLQKENPQQTKPLTVLNQNNGTPSRQHLKKSDEKPHILSTIKQGKQESEFTKHIEPSFLGVDKKDDVRISDSIFSSGTTPRMDDNCIISNISRPTLSPLKTITEQQKGVSRSEVKVEQKSQPLRQHNVEKQNIPTVFREQGSIIKEKKESEILKDSHLVRSNISNKSNNNLNEKSGSVIVKQSNQITTDEIKINVLSDKKGGVQHEMNNENDELQIPTEQNFQLGCSFEINNLIIDMNKVVW